jgi:hypothetical protein
LHDVKAKAQLEPWALLAIAFQIAKHCTRWRGNFKGFSQDGGRAKIAKNIRASPFNKDLSNDTTFSQIHLDGQYL